MMGLYSGVAIIVQARLSSRRLPRKVLLPLGGKPLLSHVLQALKTIPVERYILTCDENSEKELAPIAKQEGYICITGSETDVLDRFCTVIQKFQDSASPIQTVIRVTSDNPFIFTPAVASSLRRYIELHKPEYFTLVGLPHGSGIEIFNAQMLLSAAKLTSDEYEHEHVSPALYRHPDRYKCIREPAPAEWYFPDLRTTVDTSEDYVHAQQMCTFLEKNKCDLPASPEALIAACQYADHLIVFVPSIVEGQGSGHLRRVCTIIAKLAQRVRCALYIPEEERPQFIIDLLEKIDPSFIVTELPRRAALIVLDNFRTDADLMERYREHGPVVALDEGGDGRAVADYVLDIIPSLKNVHNYKNSADSANIFDPGFIPLPINRKKNSVSEEKDRHKRIYLKTKRLKTLVICGGENASGMALPLAENLAHIGFDVSVIDQTLEKEELPFDNAKVKKYIKIENLREQLYEWDIIFTHYGFTAFEALAAGCFVVLVSPTEYHYLLGNSAGFTTFEEGVPTREEISALLQNGIKIPSVISPQSKARDLSLEIKKLSRSGQYPCSLCGDDFLNPIVGRAPNKTVRFCLSCKMKYLSFCCAEAKKYEESYFFDEYKAQYGKTYLEDFESIKKNGLRRMKHIQDCYKKNLKGEEKNLFMTDKKVLDIGCAYGPFLAAVKDSGWIPIGTDISEAAVQHVCDELQIPACVSSFPVLPESFDFVRNKSFTTNDRESVEIHLKEKSFSALTMWFVIEHFQDLDAVLKKAVSLLVPGGVFAFSTPNVAGVSGRFSWNKFVSESPSDHFSLWDARTLKKQLDFYGFKVIKIVSIGHHPERFPWFCLVKEKSIWWKILLIISKIFKLGDSMEIYAIKRGSLEDV